MFEALLSKLVSQLKLAKIPYMIIGGQAVLIYGEPRLTKDIDITLGIAPADSNKLLSLINNLKLKVLVDNVEDFLNQTFVLPCEEIESGIRIDFIFSLSEYETFAISRARKIKIGQSEVSFISPEDLVIFKLIANRPRDIDDVKGVIAKNPTLDLDYITRWLIEFDTSLETNNNNNFQQMLKIIAKNAT